MEGLYTFKNVFLCNKSSRIIYSQLFEFLVLQSRATQFLFFNFFLLMPDGSFHPGPCTNTTSARAAGSFLGGACSFSLGNERNSKKCGIV